MAPPPALKYLQLLPIAGRGGIVRFFLLIHVVEFVDQLISMSDWPAVKAKMIASQENPCGAVPTLTIVQDGDVPPLVLSQHIAICRYVFRNMADDSTTASPMDEMVQDMVADEYHGWSNALWSTFGASAEAKALYQTEQLPKYLVLMNALYEKYAAAPFLSTSSRSGRPLWADVAVATMVYDNIMMGFLTTDELVPYPKINALYQAFCALTLVAEWMKQAAAHGATTAA